MREGECGRGGCGEAWRELLGWGGQCGGGEYGETGVGKGGRVGEWPSGESGSVDQLLAV